MNLEYQHSSPNKFLAPIVLFVYNRPKHTLKTLEALAENNLANQSLLYIFSDGYNDNASEKLIADIHEVRSLIRTKQWCKKVIIKEAKLNKGLANSIIAGITEVMDLYDKVIVLEDDLIPATYFLNYMNEALDLYEKNSTVFQVAGFSFPVKDIGPLHSSYFLSLTSTWGWATWKRVWNSIDFECKDYTTLLSDKKLAYRFNFSGAYDYTKLFVQQMETQKVSSWGIRFYWNVFKSNGLVLFPDKTLILNKGWDNTGRHKDNYELFPVDDWDSNYKILHFPQSIAQNKLHTSLISRYLKKRTSLLTKINYKIEFVLKDLLTKKSK